MNRLVLFMARWRITWVLWLSLGSPLFLFAAIATITTETWRHWYSMWHWTWRYDIEWARDVFSEKHRKSLRSLALKPAPGGMVQHT